MLISVYYSNICIFWQIFGGKTFRSEFGYRRRLGGLILLHVFHILIICLYFNAPHYSATDGGVMLLVGWSLVGHVRELWLHAAS